MKRFLSLVTVALVFAVAFPLTAQGQMESESKFKIGPRVTIALGDLSDIGADLALGGDVRYDLSASVDAPIQLSGAFDFYFTEDTQIGGQEIGRTVFTIDLNGHYMIPNEGTLSPYVGGGIGITGSSTDEVQTGSTTAGGGSNTDLGLNLVGGAEFQGGSIRPFAEAHTSLGGDFTRFGITGGILFAL